uniref:Uncharacterized protein n=1 Tax=Stomoxys calcitrans TaxID=35570 RepID=A0A1I8NMR1_STOCA|nr:unnamed protein product [Stomoxys calcitrans]
MWREVSISQKPYFIKCSFNEDDNYKRLTCILYDRKDYPWIAEQELGDVKRKVKLLNRRYDFNEEHIRATFAEGELQSASLEKEAEKAVLKLKYRFKNCPFNYEWALVKQTMHQFQEVVVKPMLTALISCKEQIDILKDTLKKKDAEILQYRREGAILGRKTLATKLFDFDEFARKYESRNKLLGDFSELGKFLVQSESHEKRLPTSSPKREPQNETTTTEKPVSPGQRKRKMLKQQMLETALNTRATTFEYESSQSQGLSQEFEETAADNNASKEKISNQFSKKARTTDVDMDQQSSGRTNSSPRKQEQRNENIKRDEVSKATNARKILQYENSTNVKAGTSPSIEGTKIHTNKDKLSHSWAKTTTMEESVKNTLQNSKEVKSPEKGGQRRNKIVTPSTLEVNNKKGFKYESSSSQTTNSTNSQLTEEFVINASNKQVLKNKESPRSGHIEAKQRKEMLNNGKDETDSDTSISAMPKRRRSRQLSLSQEDDNEVVRGDKKVNNDEKSIESDKNLKTSPRKGRPLAGNSAEKRTEGTSPRYSIRKHENSKEVCTEIISDSDCSANADEMSSSKRGKRKREFPDMVKNGLKNSQETSSKSPSIGKKTFNCAELSDSEKEDIAASSPPRKRRICLSLNRTPEKKPKPGLEAVRQTAVKSGTDTDEPCVVDISTDSEYNDVSYTPASKMKKKTLMSALQQESPSFLMKSRVTRSSPQILSTPKPVDDLQIVPNKSIEKTVKENTDALAIGEITSQLESIRKELESLEALRLADLKHRTCKA